MRTQIRADKCSLSKWRSRHSNSASPAQLRRAPSFHDTGGAVIHNLTPKDTPPPGVRSGPLPPRPCPQPSRVTLPFPLEFTIGPVQFRWHCPPRMQAKDGPGFDGRDERLCCSAHEGRTNVNCFHQENPKLPTLTHSLSSPTGQAEATY